jgi:hypothetical protein
MFYYALYIRISYNSVTLANCMPRINVRHIDIMVRTTVFPFSVFNLSLYFTRHIKLKISLCLIN